MHGKDPSLDVVEEARSPRPFLMISFRCRAGDSYQRVYRSLDGSHYLARCPKCGKSVRFVVGDGGTGARSFVVECG